ncbi:sensor histidine kinase [Nesterenkonia halotolerans]|uniref:histidine kinase n=1 Tax=Nesterenkonia halotolerans TaxID=225325 RepID=A0ABR9J8G9_9MICC|nr:sensor histidine kinase [Nesterenkonia halotolerans]MBE1515299.1 two-component system OmpR family sensor kinase [Nesterenkonia halotolerans]
MRPIRSLTQTWRKSSLRTQLVLIMSGLLVLTLFVTTFVSASLFRQELLRNLDEDIESNANSVSMYLTRRSAPEFGDSQSIFRFYGILMNSEGELLQANSTHAAGYGGDIPEIPNMTFDEVLEQWGEPMDVPGTEQGSRGWRVHVIPLENGEDTLAVGLPLEPVETSVERATFLVATIGLLATLGASTIAYALVTRAFRSLFHVEKTAAEIAGGDFSQRVETTAPPETEIGRLSRSLNVMLEHIETAFQAKSASEENMRRFIQDASHELRTPLVTIRGFSELYRQGGVSDNPEAVGMAMGRIESEAKRMGQLVEDMLTLARLDEQRPMQQAPLDLNLIAHDAIMDLAVNAPDRTTQVIGLTGATPAPAPALGDEGRIRQIVTNLVTNALRYTPDGTPLELAVGTQTREDGATDAVLEVRDHGEGIAEEDAAKIFDRFFRADNSRQRETGGTGLGLAICAAIASQHDGTVRHSTTEGGGATMTLRLPMVAPEDQSDHETDIDDEELDQLRAAAREHHASE